MADAVPAARARLNHPAAEVRAAAVGALARIGGDQAQQALISALGDADLGVRRLAVNALGDAAGEGRGARAAGGVPEARDAVGGASPPCPACPTPARWRSIIEGLGAKNPGVRDECRKALAAIREEVRPQVRDRLDFGHPARPGRPRTRDHLRR